MVALFPGWGAAPESGELQGPHRGAKDEFCNGLGGFQVREAGGGRRL